MYRVIINGKVCKFYVNLFSGTYISVYVTQQTPKIPQKRTKQRIKGKLKKRKHEETLPSTSDDASEIPCPAIRQAFLHSGKLFLK